MANCDLLIKLLYSQNIAIEDWGDVVKALHENELSIYYNVISEVQVQFAFNFFNALNICLRRFNLDQTPLHNMLKRPLYTTTTNDKPMSSVELSTINITIHLCEYDSHFGNLFNTPNSNGNQRFDQSADMDNKRNRYLWYKGIDSNANPHDYDRGDNDWSDDEYHNNKPLCILMAEYMDIEYARWAIDTQKATIKRAVLKALGIIMDVNTRQKRKYKRVARRVGLLEEKNIELEKTIEGHLFYKGILNNRRRQDTNKIERLHQDVTELKEENRKLSEENKDLKRRMNERFNSSYNSYNVFILV